MRKLCAFLLMVAFCLLLCACGKAENYAAAVALMEEECYAEAIAAFAELEEYEDSAQRLETCRGMVYEEAWNLLIAYEFEEAHGYFSLLEDYEDCEEIIRKWDSIRSYMEAEKLYKEEQYEEALAVFADLGEFRDSLDRAEKCRNALAYENAVLLMERGEYEEAATAFLGLEGYEDSAQLLEECKQMKLYTEAEKLFGEERYEEAAELYDQLGDYKDCAEKWVASDRNARYAKAAQLQAEEKYEDALTIFTGLGEFSDSAEKAAECQNALMYIKAVALMDAGEYAEAKEIFLSLDDYENSEACWKVCATELMLDDPLYRELMDLLGIAPLTETIDYGCVVPDAYGNGDTEIYLELKNGQPPEPEYTVEMGNGCNVRIPMTYGELYEAGWRVAATNWQADFDVKEAKLSNIFLTDEMIFCDMVGINGKTINVTLHNTQKEAVELRTVPVTGIVIYGSEMQGISINGITQGATASEIIKAFGWPHLIHAMYGDCFKNVWLYYHDEHPVGDNLSIYLDEKTGQLENFSYSTWPE